MSDEIVALDLDWDLLNHLALPESVARLRAEHISEELIEDELVLEVFNWQMEHYREHKQPATASVLEDEFEDITIDDPLTAIDDLIGRLRQRYVRNEGKQKLEGLIETYQEDPLDIAHKMIEEGQRLSNLIVRRGDAFGPGDFDRSLEIYNKMVLQGPGVTMGFKELDEHFHGQRGVTVLLAPPKGYKSWITINAFVEAVIEGRSAELVSLELPAHEAYNRALHLAANIPWWKHLRGALSQNDKEKLREANELLSSCGTYNVVHPDHGERKVDQMVNNARDRGADVVFIDQLQYIETLGGRSVGAKNETGDYFEVLGRLRDYSDEGPIWVVHQFNRTTMFADEMPDMRQAKGSSAIEETATTVLGLWANKDMRSSNITQLGTLASRNYEWYNWELEVSLNRECNFKMIGRVED